MQRELSCVWMRCGAACGQGLRTPRSMRTRFADAAQHADAFFVIRANSNAYVQNAQLYTAIKTYVKDNWPNNWIQDTKNK